MKILIIDDSQTARMFTKKCVLMAFPQLKDSFNFTEAVNGEDALQKLSQDKVDLILSDVNMPVMTGFTFIRNIKMNDNLKTIPIIFITSLANDARKNNLIELGAFDVISKPTNPKVLGESLKKLPLMQQTSAPKENNTNNNSNSNSNSNGGWGN